MRVAIQEIGVVGGRQNLNGIATGHLINIIIANKMNPAIVEAVTAKDAGWQGDVIGHAGIGLGCIASRQGEFLHILCIQAIGEEADSRGAILTSPSVGISIIASRPSVGDSELNGDLTIDNAKLPASNLGSPNPKRLNMIGVCPLIQLTGCGECLVSTRCVEDLHNRTISDGHPAHHIEAGSGCVAATPPICRDGVSQAGKHQRLNSDIGVGGVGVGGDSNISVAIARQDGGVEAVEGRGGACAIQRHIGVGEEGGGVDDILRVVNLKLDSVGGVEY